MDKVSFLFLVLRVFLGVSNRVILSHAFALPPKSLQRRGPGVLVVPLTSTLASSSSPSSASKPLPEPSSLESDIQSLPLPDTDAPKQKYLSNEPPVDDEREYIDLEPQVQPATEGWQSERVSLDIKKTIYTSTIKTPKDAYTALAEKGAANAKMPKTKIFHQSVLGGCYVGFGGLVSLTIAGGLAGLGAANPAVPRLAFAALFPVNLLLIVTTGGQLFTGNSAAVAAARWEGLVTWRQLHRNWAVSIAGNVVGCALFAWAAWYVGLLKEGTAAMLSSTAWSKCRNSLGPTIVKAILCNWMVSLAVCLAGAANSLCGKLIAVWFPISTFVAIGLEHSVANMFILPAALLLGVPLTLRDVILRNVGPALIGNALAGALVVAASYAFQFGKSDKRETTNQNTT